MTAAAPDEPLANPLRTQVAEAPVIDHASDPVQSDHQASDPSALALSWLPKSDEDRMLMTVSTIDSEGFPRARTVMLSEFDGEHFFFHTDASSQKAHDLSANPRVSLSILWPGFTRQLVVQGTALIAPPDEVASAYAKRSPYLKQLAWLNTPEYAQLPLRERVSGWRDFAATNPTPAQPHAWAGFAVRAHRMLFWVSNPDAASRRVEYHRGEAGWSRQILPG